MPRAVVEMYSDVISGTLWVEGGKDCQENISLVKRHARDHSMQSKIARNIKICVTCTNCTKMGSKLFAKKLK